MATGNLPVFPPQPFSFQIKFLHLKNLRSTPKALGFTHSLNDLYQACPGCWADTVLFQGHNYGKDPCPPGVAPHHWDGTHLQFCTRDCFLIQTGPSITGLDSIKFQYISVKRFVCNLFLKIFFFFLDRETMREGT